VWAAPPVCSHFRHGTLLRLAPAAALETAIRSDTRLVWVETPTNPLLKLVDLARVASIGRHSPLRLRFIWAAGARKPFILVLADRDRVG